MQGWQDIQAEALRRIQRREWTPGSLIPGEAELAREFGCARATVNRALQALAEDGWLERRRRAGTRVALSPQRRAQMSVPVLRQEIEAHGNAYTHQLLHAHSMGDTLFLHTLHLSDSVPYALENREINLSEVPAAAREDWTTLSANEWLVQNAPFDHGTMIYEAIAAAPFEAANLLCAEGSPLLVLRRETFSGTGLITCVTLAYAPAHAVRLQI